MFEHNVDFIDDFLKSKAFAKNVLYAIMPVNEEFCEYDVVIEVTILPKHHSRKKDTVKIEQIVNEFKHYCNKNSRPMRTRFYMQRR